MVRSTLALAALATFALVLSSAPDAGAATVLSTPFVPANNGQKLLCLATNVGSKPIQVTAALFSVNGVAVTPLVDSCSPVSLQPMQSCLVTFNDGCLCIVTSSSSKVRADIILLNGTTGAVEAVAPATK